MTGEVWEATLQGVKSYGAFGPRDVLLIASSEGLEGPDIVPRRRGQLTAEDKQRLSSEGIPQDCWEDDLKLMEKRYEKDVKCSLVPKSSKEVLTREYVIEEIYALMNNTTQPGVILHYIGPGRRHTGDWCFPDGFIQFSDLLDAYMQHFRPKGKCLTIISDCSHSGQWVRACRDYLDAVEVQPCGHSGREKNMLLKVRASCRSHQIPHTLLYSARGMANDKNHEPAFVRPDGYEVEQNQQVRMVDSSLVCCKKGASFQDPCSLPRDYTWHKRGEGERVQLVRGQDGGRRAWHYILLVDDEETIDKFHKAAWSANIQVTDFGEILKSGWGDDPPEEMLEWIKTTYPKY